MAMIEKFEDIVAWQEARNLTRSIYATAKREPEKPKHLSVVSKEA